jgi:hypothetical protein
MSNLEIAYKTIQRKTPAEQASLLSERPTPEMRSPAVKMKSQESAKIRITSHRANGSAERPIIRNETS